MLEIMCKVAILWVFKLLGYFRAKSSSNLICFARNLAHNNFWYYYSVERFRILNHSYILVKLRFFGFLSFLGTFAHKVAKTWFVLHKTRHTTLFGICYCVEIVIIENHSYMLAITW